MDVSRKLGCGPRHRHDLDRRQVEAFAEKIDVDELKQFARAKPPQQFGARIKAEMAKWGKVVHAAKLKIE